MTMKELFAPSDMTVGKPWEKIVAFTIPMADRQHCPAALQHG